MQLRIANYVSWRFEVSCPKIVLKNLLYESLTVFKPNLKFYHNLSQRVVMIKKKNSIETDDVPFLPRVAIPLMFIET